MPYFICFPKLLKSSNNYNNDKYCFLSSKELYKYQLVKKDIDNYFTDYIISNDKNKHPFLANIYNFFKTIKYNHDIFNHRLLFNKRVLAEHPLLGDVLIISDNDFDNLAMLRLMDGKLTRTASNIYRMKSSFHPPTIYYMDDETIKQISTSINEIIIAEQDYLIKKNTLSVFNDTLRSIEHPKLSWNTTKYDQTMLSYLDNIYNNLRLNKTKFKQLIMDDYGPLSQQIDKVFNSLDDAIKFKEYTKM